MSGKYHPVVHRHSGGKFRQFLIPITEKSFAECCDPVTVILCDGDFPTHDIPLEILNKADKIVCCDGAASELLSHGREPFAIVGDMDSLPYEIKEKYSDRVFVDTCRETNDLTKAVNWCVERKYNNLTILGATGKREDHTLGNISLLADYSTSIKVKMFTDTGVFLPINESAVFKVSVGQQISIFSITPETSITTSGLKYNVVERQFKSWYQGTLNEAESGRFGIYFDKGHLIIFFRYEYQK